MFGPPCVTSGGTGEGSCTGDTHAVDHGVSATTNLVIDHMWMHRFAEIVRPYQWTNYTIQYSDLDTTRETPDEHEDLVYGANPSSGTMRYNVFWGSANDGIFFDEGGNSLTFYGNVIYNSGGGLLVFKDGFANGAVIIYNNTFSSDESFGDFVCPSNCPWIDTVGTPSSLVVKNNVFDHVVADGSFGTADYNAYSTDIGKQDSGTHSFTYTSAFAPSNTQFITTSTSNPIIANYRLTSTGATTFGAGVSLSSPYNVDPDGNTRGGSGIWDVGAYQFSSGVTGTSISLSPSSFTPAAGSNITLTASITPSSGPTGTITFFDGATNIGTSTLPTLTHTVTAITAGTHVYTATYGGDSSYSSSTSSSATVAASGPSGSIVTTGTTFKGGVVVQ
jgi:hypothetical protein